MLHESPLALQVVFSIELLNVANGEPTEPTKVRVVQVVSQSFPEVDHSIYINVSNKSSRWNVVCSGTNAYSVTEVDCKLINMASTEPV